MEIIKKEFNYSNEQLGEICGVSYTAIGNIINGITKDPGVSLFIRLSKQLEINVEWLLFGEGEMLRKHVSKNHPEAVKYLGHENDNLKILIQSKDSEINTLKKIINLLENRIEVLSDKKQVG
ncbi:MAG TPA: helix-turn-helix transcriptional regulator [Cytophagaceae bacterium]|nr:helix-turn-helix transcriptional regulator [Cytophagaceae bacterium]